MFMKTIIDQPKIDVRVKMSKVNHQGVLIVRYFFIELLADSD